MAPQIPPNPASGPPETLTWVFEAESPLEPSTVPREILENSYPPSETHIRTLQGFISRGIPRRARLDSKIAILQAALDKTLAERALLDAEIRKHEDAASLVRSLPPEIMTSIFAFVPTPNLLESDAGGPWSICAVCSRWRSIALTEPSLWTHIFLDFVPALDCKKIDLGRRVSRLEAHLERSAQSPLSVYFRSSFQSGQVIYEGEYIALDILQKHCHRWQTLEMIGPKPLFAHLDVKDSLLLLRALDIRVYNEIEVFTDDPLGELHTFANCPSLQVATVNRHAYPTPSDVILPFRQLLQYSAGNVRGSHLNAICSASNLVDCALLVRNHDLTPLPPNTQRIQLPNLLRLSISGAEILRILDTPVLQEFYCKQPSTALHAFLKRLKRLQKLVVLETSSAGDTTLLLEAAPTITELGLYVPMDFAQEFQSAFRPSASKIPCLTTLSVGFIPLRDFLVNPPLIDQDLIMRMFEGQWRDGHSRSVNFYCLRFTPSQDTLERLKVLREQGLEINLFRRPESLTRVMLPDYFDIWDDKLYDIQDLFWKMNEEAAERASGTFSQNDASQWSED